MAYLIRLFCYQSLQLREPLSKEKQKLPTPQFRNLLRNREGFDICHHRFASRVFPYQGLA
jgi:hypothetical protein